MGKHCDVKRNGITFRRLEMTLLRMMELARPIKNKNDALIAVPADGSQVWGKTYCMFEHAHSMGTITDDTTDLAHTAYVVVHISTDCYGYILRIFISAASNMFVSTICYYSQLRSQWCCVPVRRRDRMLLVVVPGQSGYESRCLLHYITSCMEDVKGCGYWGVR